MNCLIIEDEALAANGLRAKIERLFPKLKILGISDSVEEGYSDILALKPNLVFLDIQMMDGTGFDLLKRFTSINFHVIFTTAYDRYAMQAFKYSAADYLLKPISPDELVDAVKRVEERRIDMQLLEQMEVLLSNYHGEGSKNRKLAIQSAGKVSFLPMNDILYLKADGAYTHIFMSSGVSVLSSKNLKHYDELLEDPSFYRTNRSYLINLNMVIEFSKNDCTVILKNGHVIPVSEHKKTDLIDIIARGFTK